ncbi:MAG: hypothetical protein ACR2IE_06985 [Candidatus Sumerlaeaceae bacterium]
MAYPGSVQRLASQCFGRCAVWLFCIISVAAPAQDIVPLSDDFGDPSTLGNWQHVYQVEQWNANQLQVYDINTSRPGWMTMVPYTSTWYNNYRGIMAFKSITGDFVATTHLQVGKRDGSGQPPQSSYSLAGILVRQPRNITPATWTAGGENYIFLAMGAANTPGQFQFEVKSTLNSVSGLGVTNTNTSESYIQVCRVAQHFITLRRTASTTWTVHQRFNRSDLPSALQVGLCCYTDFNTCSNFTPFVHNSSVITTGTPDLRAQYDYMRFQRPNVPPALQGADLSNPSAVTDAQLLSFLGDNAIPSARVREWKEY